MTEKITFESLPQAVEMILKKIEGLESVLETLAGTGGSPKDKWLATGKRKTDEEIQMEVAKYMESNKFGV